MRALVTGATGFLGYQLANTLQQQGWRVTAVGRNHQKAQQLLHPQVTFKLCDLADREQAIALTKHEEVVFHCAGRSSDWGAAQQFYESNTAATAHLIEGALQHSVKRFIHVSTPSVLFDFQDRFHINEDQPYPMQFANHYARTKHEAERLILQATQQGLPAIIIRPRAIYGPGDQALFPRLLRAHHKTGIPLINDGQALLDLTFVDNVIDAMLCCVEAPNSSIGEIYHISNDQPISFVKAITALFNYLGEQPNFRKLSYTKAYRAASFVEAIYRMLPGHKAPPFTKMSIGLISKSQTFDITKAKQQLGYQPRITIDEGFLKFAQWWKSQRS